MAVFSAAAIFFIIWWITLFVVLPHGNSSQAEDGEVVQGTDPGAPTNSQLPRKLMLNTVISFVLFAIYWWGFDWLGWDFSDIPSVFPEDLKPRG